MFFLLTDKNDKMSTFKIQAQSGGCKELYETKNEIQVISNLITDTLFDFQHNHSPQGWTSEDFASYYKLFTAGYFNGDVRLCSILKAITNAGGCFNPCRDCLGKWAKTLADSADNTIQFQAKALYLFFVVFLLSYQQPVSMDLSEMINNQTKQPSSSL